ncbi:MAG TPA: MFS transporter, partial [Tepidiformaceae bacterium]|nr:MFS transporter [Tepidiformaceae bacterium]
MLRNRFPNVYEGWLVVGAVALIVTMIGAAFFYGFGLIFTPVREEFGWSNAAVAFAFSLRTEAGGLAAPLVGVGVDRFGPRRVLIGGIGLMALGVVMMSFMENLWQFYLAMIVIALGTSS